MGRQQLITDRIKLELKALLKAREKEGKRKPRAGEALVYLQHLTRIGLLPRDTKLPGESSIRKTLQKLTEPSNNPLDKPWSVGACIQHNIPSDSVALLNDLRKQMGDKLTIRIARWVVFLKPVITPLLDNELKEDEIGSLTLIAANYATLEASSEESEEVSDTSELDAIYFSESKISSMRLLNGNPQLFDEISDGFAKHTGGDVIQ